MSDQNESNSFRRVSTRSIKRKKFDDELVESSLAKTDRYTKIKVANDGKNCITNFSSQGSVDSESSVLETNNIVTPSKTINIKKPIESPVNCTSISFTTNVYKRKNYKVLPYKRTRKQKKLGSTKDLGRWKPQDDLALITCVNQTNNLLKAYTNIKFTCHLSLNEIEERWYTLLYDQKLSRASVNAMKQLHPEMVQTILSNCLFSENEESLLRNIPSNTDSTIETFNEVLLNNKHIFHPSRSSSALQNHWKQMKLNSLLCDQISYQDVCNFSDAEKIILYEDEQLLDQFDEIFEKEIGFPNREKIRNIKKMKEESNKLEVVVDSVVGINPVDFDVQTFAVLKGRLVRFLIRSKQITIGRQTPENIVDVDLTLEGPAHKISRNQAIIKMNNNEFSISNEGKRPFYIDGKVILNGQKTNLMDNSTIEISCLRLIFLINEDLLTNLKFDSHNCK